MDTKILTYTELDSAIQNELQKICDNDPYGLNPNRLYINIVNSTGTNENLAQLFEVPIWLINAIKGANDATH